MGASLPSGVGVGVLVGAAVGTVVGPTVGAGDLVAVASGLGVFAGCSVAVAMLAGTRVSLGSGAGVAPAQASKAIKMTVSTVATRGKDFVIGGSPHFGEVLLPFYWVTSLLLSTLQSAIHGALSLSSP